MFGDPQDSPELCRLADGRCETKCCFPTALASSFSLARAEGLGGWPGMHKIFEKSSGFHPADHSSGPVFERRDARAGRPAVRLDKIVPREWKKLDENLLGEFGLDEMLKQFLGKDRADDLAPGMGRRPVRHLRAAAGRRDAAGDPLCDLRSDTAAARFLGGYSEALELKDEDRTNLFRRPNFFSFDTPDGGVFLRCFASECLSAEGTNRKVFDAMTHAIALARRTARTPFTPARQRK